MPKIGKKATATPAPSADVTTLLRGVSDIVPEKLFVKRLKMGERMRLYLGVDPTGPDIHIGHAVILRAMRELQDLGHEVILLFGDFTARIGDPTGKDTTRPVLTHEEILKNAETYKEQAGKILDFSRKAVVPARIDFNAKWLDKLNFQDVMELAANFTVQQMLERDMFAKRITEERPIYVHEFFYPMMQGYDSVAMDVDLEVGGTDQLFNMLAGRTLVKNMLNKEKMVMTFELLEGTDGRKMSKSYGNIIGVMDEPADMYGKVMSLADELIPRYFQLATNVSRDKIEQMTKELERGDLHPRDAKMELAREIATIYHSEKAAQSAEEEFLKVFQQKGAPTDIPDHIVSSTSISLVDLVIEVGFAKSKSETRRLIEQGGVRINDEKQADVATMVAVEDEMILQVGKRKFVTLRVK